MVKLDMKISVGIDVAALAEEIGREVTDAVLEELIQNQLRVDAESDEPGTVMMEGPDGDLVGWVPLDPGRAFYAEVRITGSGGTICSDTGETEGLLVAGVVQASQVPQP